MLLNKADLAAYFDFDLDYFRRGVAMVNPDAPAVRRLVPQTGAWGLDGVGERGLAGIAAVERA